MGTSTEVQHFSGQGRFSFAERDALGNPTGGYTFLGDCSKLDLKCTVERKEHNEHQSGFNGVDNVFESANKVEMNFTLDEIIKEALNLYVYGNTTEVAAASITAEAATAYLGKETPTAFIPDGAVTVTNVGGATTYVLGTDYKIGSTGMIYIPPTGSAITDGQDLELNYQSKDERVTTAFTQQNKPYYFRFDGLNRADDGKEVVVEIYKGRCNPAEMVDLINEDFATYSVNGMALYDNCHADNSLTGAYFRVRLAG
ncbi:MAG: hypothetical protein AAGE96_05325 [Cyanobacteria bacterium P01_G01_bin.19]